VRTPGRARYLRVGLKTAPAALSGATITNHPVAQIADCYCGSGSPVLLCCRAGDHDKPCDCHSGKTFQDCCLTTEAADLLFRAGAL
jgi:hypothetical protein